MQSAALKVGVLRTLILRIFLGLKQAGSLIVMPAGDIGQSVVG